MVAYGTCLVFFVLTRVSQRTRHSDTELDFHFQTNDQGILSSPSYLHEDGRPVIVIWGLGFAGRQHDPKHMIRLVRWLRNSVEGGVWLMAGTRESHALLVSSSVAHEKLWG